MTPWTSLPGSSVHGISQVRILEWVIISFSRGSSQPRDRTFLHLLHCRWILYHWTTREALYKLYGQPYKSLWNKNKTNYTHSYFWYLIQPHQEFGYDFLPEIVQSVTQFDSWVPVRPWFLPFDLFMMSVALTALFRYWICSVTRPSLLMVLVQLLQIPKNSTSFWTSKTSENRIFPTCPSLYYLSLASRYPFFSL